MPTPSVFAARVRTPASRVLDAARTLAVVAAKGAVSSRRAAAGAMGTLRGYCA